MREILFRGKRPLNGKWLYGFYNCTPNGYVTIKEEGKTGNPALKVFPETVGQYTGLKDKNGLKIFEGDIVVCDRHINDEFDKKTFVVREICPISGLIGKSLSGNEICGNDWEFAEVIGNIHDNPELLKEGGEK